MLNFLIFSRPKFHFSCCFDFCWFTLVWQSSNFKLMKNTYLAHNSLLRVPRRHLRSFLDFQYLKPWTGVDDFIFLGRDHGGRGGGEEGMKVFLDG